MKKRILTALLLLTSYSYATTTVSGHLSTLGTGSATSSSGSFVRFYLRGCRGNQPRITGTGAIAPQQSANNVFYFDIAADGSGNISGTVYSTRDSAGTGNGEIECGGSYTAVWYGMVVYSSGVAGPEVPVHAKSGATLDISNVTPITTTPVTTSPTGDGTYLRLDGGNSPVTGPITFQGNNTFSGNNTHSGSETFTGTVTSNNLNGWLFVNGTNYATVAAALSALGSNPGTIYITPGTYNTSATITLGQGQHLVATAPCNLRESATTNCGATITWTGATSTPVINVHNASGASVEGITVDCANISGCIAYLYDSNNSPASTNSRFIGINAKGFHFGFVAGTGSTTPDVNGYQADTFRLEQFQFYGNCADLTSEGIIINSSNAGQHSVIDRGNIQCVNVAAEGVKSNGYIEFRRFNAGSPVGVNPTFLKVDADFGPYLAEVTETEGGWSFPVHDSSALGTANNSTWRLNQWNSTAGQVLVDGNSTILSENNQATATTWAVGGTAKIISIDEAVWNPTAAVTTFSTDGVTFGPQVKTFNYIAATASGSVPAGTVAGDMVSVNDATNGTVRLGSDGLGVLNRDSAGNLNSSKGYRVGAGGVNWIETTAPTAGAGQIPCYADSTSHTLKCDYNNTSFLNMAQIITATLTTTAATTDNVTVTGMTASGHCYLTPTNSGAAGGIASVFISNKTTNQITVTHTATSGWTFDVVCSPQ